MCHAERADAPVWAAKHLAFRFFVLRTQNDTLRVTLSVAKDLKKKHLAFRFFAPPFGGTQNDTTGVILSEAKHIF